MSGARRPQIKWTAEEDELLRKLAKAGQSATDIAKHIDRSVGSIRDRVSRLNIALAKSRRLKVMAR
jgi:DNA-binding NarL/FixJ family response regulator